MDLDTQKQEVGNNASLWAGTQKDHSGLAVSDPMHSSFEAEGAHLLLPCFPISSEDRKGSRSTLTSIKEHLHWIFRKLLL